MGRKHSRRRRKRARAKAARPTQATKNPDEVFSGEVLRAITQLRSCLPLSESTFVGVSSSAQKDAKAFVLYSALDDVAKAIIQHMAAREMLQGEAVAPLQDLFSRLIVTQFVEPIEMCGFQVIVDTGINSSWTPRSGHRGHRDHHRGHLDRAIVDSGEQA